MVAFDHGLDLGSAFAQRSESAEVRVNSDCFDAGKGRYEGIEVCSDAEFEHPVEGGGVAGDPAGDLIGPEAAESDRSVGVGHVSSVVVLRLGLVDSPPDVLWR